MSKRKYHITIGGNVSGQVAVGDHIAQVAGAGAPKTGPGKPGALTLGKVKVLLLATHPLLVGPSGWEREVRRLESEVRAAAPGADLALIPALAGDPGQLRHALLNHRPHVVHFSHPDALSGGVVPGVGPGFPPVSPAEWSDLFQACKDTLRVVLLDTCFPEPQATAFMEAVGCVVCLGKALGDPAALAFAAAFYQALGLGRSVREAFDLARTQLASQGVSEEAAPRLRVRSGVDAAQITLLPDPPTAPQGAGIQQEVNKAVVVVDLSRYSDISRKLERQLGPSAIDLLNRQIQDLIKRAILAVGVAVHQVPYESTGDGAIIALDKAEQASRFAEALHLAARDRNSRMDQDDPLAQRHFRVGVSTSNISLKRKTTRDDPFPEFEMAGTAIADAVRLEAACRTGEVLITQETWEELPESERRLYGAPEEVAGKRRERYQGRRRKVVEPAPWDR